jgi:glycosyltransferase involved in cell wall biosynthesis
MRVLFITSAYPAHQDDPRGIHIHRLARGLVREGVDITVLAPGAAGAPLQATLDGVAIRRACYWIPRWQHLATGIGGIMPNLRARPWLVFQVPPLIAMLAWKGIQLARPYDVIHAHWLYPAGLAGLAAAQRWRRPLVLSSHGGDLNLARHSRVLRAVISRLSHAADACVGVSETLCEQFLSLGVPSQRISCITTCGVDEMDPNAERRITNSLYHQFKHSSGLRVLYVGSLIPRKSVETLLAAHHVLERQGHALVCALVGDGSSRDQLQKMVQERRMQNVLFIDAQSPAAVPAWLQAAEVLVLPSLSEGRPVAVMEAMAAGLPVVATRIPGTQELVREGKNGLLFFPQDVDGLASCLEQLMRDEHLRRDMGRRGKSYIEADGLTTAQVARKHIALYQQVCTFRTGAEEKRAT